MSFLQPWLLAALPLVALPIIIHLINQQRFQTIRWGAMMFLLAAQRMSRGYSRLRQWLIMLFRMVVVAGIVMAVSRPLASGWLGWAAGGKADTTIVLLDRSPSMQEREAGGGQSKLETARQQLATILRTLPSNRLVLIDGATRAAQEIESPRALLDLPSTEPASAPADVPLMLQAAHDYVKSHRAGRTEIWLASDLRASDWAPESGRWKALREAFQRFPQGVRFHLLAYPQQAGNNIAVRVTKAARQVTRDGAELLVSVRLSRNVGEEKVTLPLQFEIEGSRSVLDVEVTGSQVDLRDHRIPLEATRQRGFGRVSIPADSNTADDECYFVFDEPPPRRTLIVSEDPEATLPLELAAGISAEESTKCSAEIVDLDQLPAAAWDEIGLVLWQAPLPNGEIGGLLKNFVARGGQLVCFPPREPNGEALFGQRWQGWSDERAAVESWRGDGDLLARTQSGVALPVGDLEIHRHCLLRGEFTGLASLSGGSPLVARATTDHGGVYFVATTPATRDSTLATNGVVLYAFIQRALAAGSSVLGRSRSLDAGLTGADTSDPWQRLSGGEEGISTELFCHSGVYGSGDRLVAVNRPTAEDEIRTLSDSAVAELFRGLDFDRVDDRAGNARSLIQEIWRFMLAAMLVAMLLEAVLCLPQMARAAPTASSWGEQPRPQEAGRAAA
jgi:hypothetical protein